MVSTNAPLRQAGLVRHVGVRRALRLDGCAGRLCPQEASAPKKSSDPIDGTIAAMTLEQKVGQLFVPYVTGGTVDTASAENRSRFGVDTPAQAVAELHLGGVIYFAWSANTDNPAQIARLSNGLQRANTAAGNPVPLSVATDQETGLVARVGPPATVCPGTMALGRRATRS